MRKNKQGQRICFKNWNIKCNKNWMLTSDSDCSVSNLQLIEWLNNCYISQKYKIYFGSRNNIFSKVKKKISRNYWNYI